MALWTAVRIMIVKRSVFLILMCLVLAGSSTACAPQLKGPTVPSNYVFSLRPSTTHIWLEPNPMLHARYPTRAGLVVEVYNAQGQPVDGVPVAFEVASDWAQHASVTPQRAITQNGVARAIFRASTTGAVPVMAHVENMTQQIVIAVSSLDGTSGDRLM